MIGLRQRSAPEGDDGISFIFVDRALLLEDDVGHIGKIVVEQGREGMGIEPFRNRGKAL